jgi:ferrochelatase
MEARDVHQVILAVNLGSPEAPEEAAVRTYLREFLMDKNVIDAPRPIRDIIVKGFILPKRPRQSAEAYASIWTEDGSPLIVNTQRLVAKLQDRVPVPVHMAMRYGEPSIAGVMSEIVTQYPNLMKLILLPLYPHYAMSTIGTVQDMIRKIIRKNYPQIELVIHKPFYNNQDYVNSLADSIRKVLPQDHHLLFSYHGLPVRHLKKSDITGSHCYKTANCCQVTSPAHDFCYKHQVLETTRLTAGVLKLNTDDYSVAFQSRLGRDEWISPATTDTVKQLAAGGVKKLAVVCPAFVSDCLETLEEIGIRERESFQEYGGESFILIPCLNDSTIFVDTLVKTLKPYYVSLTTTVA